MSVTLEFVGGPMDGEVMAFREVPREWRVAMPQPVIFWNPPPLDQPVPIRYGVYRFATYRQGQRVGRRDFIKDTDVLRWDGEP
jgi:hypothetical protein